MELLFLAHRRPWPPDRGDRIRSWNVLRHLAARARVHLVALDEEGGEPAPALRAVTASCTIVRRTRSRATAAALALATRRPVSLAAFDHPAVHAAVARVRRERAIDAIYAFSGQMAQYLPADDAIPVLMDLVDVDSAKFAALATGAAPPMRWLMAREARLLGVHERAVAARAAATLFVSEAEAALFRAGAGGGGGRGRIVAVGNGVDLDRYDPAVVAPVPLDRPAIVLTGQMDYFPNVAAATTLVREILPIVRREHPAAMVAIVGRAPAAAVSALAGPNVVVTGEVADARPWLAAAAACAAPLTIARGVQNKVLEAMAMARPVVASPAAAEGIDHGGAIRVADGAEAFAAALSALLGDPAAAAALGRDARRRVERRYAWDAQLAPLDALLASVVPA